MPCAGIAGLPHEEDPDLIIFFWKGFFFCFVFGAADAKRARGWQNKLAGRRFPSGTQHSRTALRHRAKQKEKKEGKKKGNPPP